MYSLNSNVSIINDVEVNSGESRVELNEQRFNGQIYTAGSTVNFDLKQDYILVLAREISAMFTLNNAQFEMYARNFTVCSEICVNKSESFSLMRQQIGKVTEIRIFMLIFWKLSV